VRALPPNPKNRQSRLLGRLFGGGTLANSLWTSTNTERMPSTSTWLLTATVQEPGRGSSRNRKAISVEVPARYFAGVRLGRQWLSSRSVSERKRLPPAPSQKMIWPASGRPEVESMISNCWIIVFCAILPKASVSGYSGIVPVCSLELPSCSFPAATTTIAPRGPNRREILRAGTAGLLGLTLPQLLAGKSPAAVDDKTFGKAKACILLFMWGGPAHQDTWDMKPDQPAQIRGEFKPIATKVPGIQICEHMPQLAQRTDKLCIVRSMTHNNADHTTGTSFHAHRPAPDPKRRNPQPVAAVRGGPFQTGPWPRSAAAVRLAPAQTGAGKTTSPGSWNQARDNSRVGWGRSTTR